MDCYSVTEYNLMVFDYIDEFFLLLDQPKNTSENRVKLIHFYNNLLLVKKYKSIFFTNLMLGKLVLVFK